MSLFYIKIVVNYNTMMFYSQYTHLCSVTLQVEPIGRKFLFTERQRKFKMKQLKAPWDNRNN